MSQYKASTIKEGGVTFTPRSLTYDIEPSLANKCKTDLQSQQKKKIKFIYGKLNV